MATLAQSELGETAAKLLPTVGERPVMIVDGDREVGAIVSIEDFEVVRKARIERVLRAFDAVAMKAEPKLKAHAAELGISPDELVERLLQDDEDR